MYCVGVMLFSRNPGDLRTRQVPVKQGREGHKCEASSGSAHLPLQQPVLHPFPLQIKENPRQTGLSEVPTGAVWGFFLLFIICLPTCVMHLFLFGSVPTSSPAPRSDPGESFLVWQKLYLNTGKKLCKRIDLGTALDSRHLPPAHFFEHHFWVQL